MPPKPVPIFSQPVTVIPSRPNDQHDIATTLAFADTLDTIPGELTKTFGDLRELDAVLNATTTNITHKLRALTEGLQESNRAILCTKAGECMRNHDGITVKDILWQSDGTRSDFIPGRIDQQVQRKRPYFNPLDRFQLLLEIAEELTRYRIGVEDKVRVTGQACDTMVAHQAHLQALLVNSSVLLASPLTTSTERSKPQGDSSHSRRQRVSPFQMAVANSHTSANGGSDQEISLETTRERDLGYDAQDATPSKKRKSGKEKDISGMDVWDSHESLVGLASPALPKKIARGASASQADKEKKNPPKRRSRNSPAGLTRESLMHARYAKYEALPVGHDPTDHPCTTEDRHSAGDSGHIGNANLDSTTNSKFPETIYPSIHTMNMHNVAKGASADDMQSKIQLFDRGSSRAASRRDGMDHSDSQHLASLNDSIEIDHDPTPYCYCQKQSYGEMIGCDADDCRYEWFHLSCLNLSQPPDGTWLCPECEAREQKGRRTKSKKNGSGGKVARKRS